MSLWSKPVERIVQSDIETLIANSVREGRTVEYKAEVPTNSDDDKREFLADVSSFANASGGDILYGIEEHRDENRKPTGVPSAIAGLAGTNMDQAMLRLDGIIRDGIEPRIAGIRVNPVNTTNGPVLVIRVPKSYSAPHMVTFKNLSRFFSRTSNGKYQLDVTEIRSAFGLSEALPERIRRFRDERLGRIIAGETVECPQDGPKVVLHLMPLSALELSSAVEVWQVGREPHRLPPMSARGWDGRYNFDGYLTHNTRGNPPVCYSYTQLFRTGAVEAVDGLILPGGQAQTRFPAPDVERQLLSATRNYLATLKLLDIQPPVVVMVTLVGVRGFYIIGPDSAYQAAIDRDTLLLPDLLVENLDDDPDVLMRPAFDALWQASGWRRCYSYDENGKRVH